VLLAGLLAACSGGSSSGSATTTSKAPTTTADQEVSAAVPFAKGWPQGAGGECNGYRPGKDHVLMTFCGGMATIGVNVDGTAHTLTGGYCWFNGTSLELDFGVAPGPGFTGPAPDYVTAQLPSVPGTYPLSTNMYFILGGETSVVGSGTVTVAPELPLGKPLTDEALAKGFTGSLKPGIEGFVTVGATGQRPGRELSAAFSC